ncbi:MAG: hypothetical protein PHT69_05630 [Bacteroidales bacterium]|nr:hypothetical protein [Bacteroidales bacterium]
MKKKYSRPILNKVRIDNQISLVLMTPGEEDPFPGPFSTGKGPEYIDRKQNPYKA